MKKRFLSLLLALVLCIGLLPAAASAAAVQPGMMSRLRYHNSDSQGVQPYDVNNEYHYVYFGKWGGKPIKWRVLDVQDETSTGSKLFLLADECLIPEPDEGWNGHIPFNPPNKVDRHLWQGSDVQTWCKDTFYSRAFTPAERALIRSTSEASSQFLIPNPNPGPPFAYQTGTLQDDYVFAPSIKEISKAEYGFTNGASLAAGPFSSPGFGRTYWLRSYATFDGIQTTTIMPTGGIGYDQTNEYRAYVRPAMYLDSSNERFALVSAADGVKSATGTEGSLAEIPSVEMNEWKLTLRDPDRRNFDVIAYDVGEYLYLAYTGAVTGDHEYISAYVTKLTANYSSVTTHYGRLGKVTGSSGFVKIAKNIIPDEGSFWMINEQYNGDRYTDYASNPVLLSPGNPKYYVDAVAVTASLTNITSTNTAPYVAKDTAYTTTLSVADADQYMLPADITVTVGGTALAASDYDYDAATGSLTVHAEKITGALHIAAEAVKKTWKISVSPEDIDFGTADYGYDEITAQTVTIQNTGNQSLTMKTPALAPATDFEMTLGSAFGANGQAVLAPNESATVTVRPKAGLGVGRYFDILEITDSTDNTGKVNEAVYLDFAVQKAIVNIPDIHGVTVPVTGETPVTTITETEQYTGTVTWSPNDAAFAAGTQYTATVTLMPKDGYKLDGVPENFFTVDGAVCTNAAGSGVITAEFPALPSNSRQTHPVTIEQSKHGRLTVNRPSAPAGVTVTITASPDDGYELGDLTVVGRNGDEIDVKYEGDNRYSFRMPVGGVTIRAEFTPRGQYGSFGDVARGDYFFDAVEWAAEQGIMDGVGGGLFAPHSACTRAQLVTILYRLEGSPAASANPFNDVARGSYYEKAVAWAAEHGIVTGYGDGLFGPNDRITREQLAAILHRYAQYKKLDVSVGEDTNILSYNDATRISDYAFPAMQWACGAGLLKGANGDLLPKNTATRAQTATILYRLASLLK